ncbi:hypothetical protein HDU82_005042, partial [Entophlyctis luteolus]
MSAWNAYAQLTGRTPVDFRPATAVDEKPRDCADDQESSASFYRSLVREAAQSEASLPPKPKPQTAESSSTGGDLQGKSCDIDGNDEPDSDDGALLCTICETVILAHEAQTHDTLTTHVHAALEKSGAAKMRAPTVYAFSERDAAYRMLRAAGWTHGSGLGRGGDGGGGDTGGNDGGRTTAVRQYIKTGREGIGARGGSAGAGRRRVGDTFRKSVEEQLRAEAELQRARRRAGRAGSPQRQRTRAQINADERRQRRRGQAVLA